MGTSQGREPNTWLSWLWGGFCIYSPLTLINSPRILHKLHVHVMLLFYIPLVFPFSVITKLHFLSVGSLLLIHVDAWTNIKRGRAEETGNSADILDVLRPNIRCSGGWEHVVGFSRRIWRIRFHFIHHKARKHWTTNYIKTTSNGDILDLANVSTVLQPTIHKV